MPTSSVSWTLREFSLPPTCQIEASFVWFVFCVCHVVWWRGRGWNMSYWKQLCDITFFWTGCLLVPSNLDSPSILILNSLLDMFYYSSKHVGQLVMLDLGLLSDMDADQFNFIRQVHPDIWDTHDSRNGCWRSRLTLC